MNIETFEQLQLVAFLKLEVDITIGDSKYKKVLIQNPHYDTFLDGRPCMRYNFYSRLIGESHNTLYFV
jgi:hypothetical protein